MLDDELWNDLVQDVDTLAARRAAQAPEACTVGVEKLRLQPL